MILLRKWSTCLTLYTFNVFFLSISFPTPFYSIFKVISRLTKSKTFEVLDSKCSLIPDVLILDYDNQTNKSDFMKYNDRYDINLFHNGNMISMDENTCKKKSK